MSNWFLVKYGNWYLGLEIIINFFANECTGATSTVSSNYFFLLDYFWHEILEEMMQTFSWVSLLEFSSKLYFLVLCIWRPSTISARGENIDYCLWKVQKNIGQSPGLTIYGCLISYPRSCMDTIRAKGSLDFQSEHTLRSMSLVKIVFL